MIYSEHSIILDPTTLHEVAACTLHIPAISCQCQQYFHRAIAGGASHQEAHEYAAAYLTHPSTQETSCQK
jgi:hypothetical protein